MNENHEPLRDLLTVEHFSKKYPAWSKPALRNLILRSVDTVDFRGNRHEANGLGKFGAIIRLGRKVLISESRFFRWVEDQQKPVR